MGSVAGLYVQALSSCCPLWLGSVLCPALVLFLSSVGSVSRSCFIFCWALSSFCPLGRAPEELCGWALWPVAAPLNFVARVAGEECGSDVNADKNSLMKRVKVGRTNFFLINIGLRRIVLKLFGVYAGIIVLV